MFVVLGKDWFVVQISNKKTMIKFPFRTINDKDWRTTDMHVHVYKRVSLFLASILMLAIIQLNCWMTSSEISLTWDPT